MRIKQTARKSTATPARNMNDPIRQRMENLLSTKRKSSTPSESKARISSLRSSSGGGGKHIYLGGRGKFIDGVKIKPRAKPGEMALKEIRRLQKSHDLQIPRQPFHRLVREITQQFDEEGQSYRYQAVALQALQEAAESYLVTLFEDSYLCTIHAKRVTLFPSDIHLVRKLQHHRGAY